MESPFGVRGGESSLTQQTSRHFYQLRRCMLVSHGLSVRALAFLQSGGEIPVYTSVLVKTWVKIVRRVRLVFDSDPSSCSQLRQKYDWKERQLIFSFLTRSSSLGLEDVHLIAGVGRSGSSSS